MSPKIINRIPTIPTIRTLGTLGTVMAFAVATLAAPEAEAQRRGKRGKDKKTEQTVQSTTVGAPEAEAIELLEALREKLSEMEDLLNDIRSSGAPEAEAQRRGRRGRGKKAEQAVQSTTVRAPEAEAQRRGRRGRGKKAEQAVQSTTHVGAMESELQRLEKIKNDKKQRHNLVDEQLAVISSALALGEKDVAHDLLVDVTSFFETLISDEGFQKADRNAQRAVIGVGESEKYYLGDPVEQVFAYIYLGILDMQKENYDFARASFASASYADRQSSGDGYDIDCYMAFVLEAIANINLDRPSEAERAFEAAHRAFHFLELASLLGNTYSEAHAEISTSLSLTPPKQKLKFIIQYNTRRDYLYLVAYEQIALANIITSGAREAVVTAFDLTRQRLQIPEKKSAEAIFLDSFSGNKAKKFAGANELLSEYELKVLTKITDGKIAAIKTREAQFDALLARIADPKNNTIIIQQRGYVAQKKHEGVYNERIAFIDIPLNATYSDTEIIDSDSRLVQTFQPSFIESVDYQTKTRGGRKMDDILMKRAATKQQMKSASAGLGFLSFFSGFVPGGSNIRTAVSIGAGIGSAVTAGVASGMNTDADIRGWYELPKEMYISVHALAPGDYMIRTIKSNSEGEEELQLSNVTISGNMKSIVLIGDRIRHRN